MSSVRSPQARLCKAPAGSPPPQRPHRAELVVGDAGESGDEGRHLSCFPGEQADQVVHLPGAAEADRPGPPAAELPAPEYGPGGRRGQWSPCPKSPPRRTPGTGAGKERGSFPCIASINKSAHVVYHRENALPRADFWAADTGGELEKELQSRQHPFIITVSPGGFGRRKNSRAPGRRQQGGGRYERKGKASSGVRPIY